MTKQIVAIALLLLCGCSLEPVSQSSSTPIPDPFIVLTATPEIGVMGDD